MTETKTNHPTEFASLFIKGVERAAELQKKSLDDAARQNTEAIAVIRRAPKPYHQRPPRMTWPDKLLRGTSKRRRA